MKTKKATTNFFALALAGAVLHFSPFARAEALKDDALKDCKRFAASDQIFARMTDKKNASEAQKDEYRKAAFVNISILFACNDPQTAEWQATPNAKEVCAKLPKLGLSEIELKPAPEKLTDQPWQVCTKDLLTNENRTRIDQAYNATSDQIGNNVARAMKGEAGAVDHEPSQDEICKSVMSERERKPKKPAIAAMATIERAYHLPDESLNLYPNESLEKFRALGFEPFKPKAKITDQAEIPEAAVLILKKTGSCPVAAETGWAAVKCGANNLFWSPSEKNKDLNQFLKDNSECIDSIQVRPNWTGANPAPAAPASTKPAAPANQVK